MKLTGFLTEKEEKKRKSSFYFQRVYNSKHNLDNKNLRMLILNKQTNKKQVETANRVISSARGILSKKELNIPEEKLNYSHLTRKKKKENHQRNYCIMPLNDKNEKLGQ